MGEYISDTPSAESETTLMKLLACLLRLGGRVENTTSETTGIKQERPTMHSLRFEFSRIRLKWFVYVEDSDMFGVGDSQMDALSDLVWNHKWEFNIDPNGCTVQIMLREPSPSTV